MADPNAMDVQELTPTKEEMVKKIEDLEEDLKNFDSFKISGVSVSRLASFAKGLVQRAEELQADLVLDVELDEQAQTQATALVEKAKKVGNGYVRACALLPDEEVPQAQACNALGDRKRSNTHLKRLELPEFRGDIREWTNWWSRFEKAIHSDPERDDGEKLQYLEMSLKNEALDFLQGYSKTGDDYHLIIEELHKRYANPDLLSQAYHQDLLALPAPGQAWREQRATLDEIVKILTCLRKLPTPVNEDAIRGLITQKFPVATLAAAHSEAQFMRLVDVLSGGPGTLTKDALEPAIECLRLPLDVQIDAMKRVLLMQEYFAQAKNEDKSTPAITFATRSNGSKPSTSGTSGQSTSAKKSTKPKMSCQLCHRENHRASQCRTFRTVNQRKAQIEKEQLCFSCLRPDHHVGACPTKKQCSSCNRGVHHVCICTERSKGTSASSVEGKTGKSGGNQQPDGKQKN